MRYVNIDDVRSAMMDALSDLESRVASGGLHSMTDDEWNQWEQDADLDYASADRYQDIPERGY